MTDVNPYAAPVHEAVLDAQVIGPSGGIWRDGNRLVMWKGATLPDRCVRCNAPAEGRRLKRTLYWHHPLIFLVVLAGVLVYVVVALVVRKKAVVTIGLCDRHYQRRLQAIFAWWLITLTCAALLWYGIRSGPGHGWAIVVARPSPARPRARLRLRFSAGRLRPRFVPPGAAWWLRPRL